MTARTGQELIKATKPYTQEDRRRSWAHLVSGLALMVAFLVAAGALPTALARAGIAGTPQWLVWLAQSALAVVGGLLIVRVFIFYHDYLHNAILRKSKVADVIFKTFGLIILTPATVWKQTHNYHHAHTAKIVGSHVGSYAMVTTKMWREMTAGQRFMYRLARHPLTILLGYFTIFIYGMCIASFLRNPRKNWDSLLSILVHGSIVAGLWWGFGFQASFFGFILPEMVACCAGGYLFYAQHNFEDIHVQPRESWNYARAALESSSYMQGGPIMNFFTGNIGYHHVHHLNPTIPFYRLPEAMAGIPELQNPGKTSLHPREIARCFKLKLWDPDKGKMVGYADAQL